MKKSIICIFLVIIYIPLFLTPIKKIFDKPFDVELYGYTTEIEKPKIGFSSFLDGTCQDSFSAWYEKRMPLRGVATRTYNTIRYEIFDLGNRPIGKNGSIFEPAYLTTELAIEGNDYSIPENEESIKEMVSHMDSVSEKLNKIGKHLFVYIAPNKAHMDPKSIPSNYSALATEKTVTVVDCFRENIEKSNIPYLICSDLVNELEYPAFYTTGIHWSRTYEQYTSKVIIDCLKQLTHKNYRNIDLLSVKSSKTPFWRDTDVYDLLNVWSYPDIDYFEYEVNSQPTEDSDSMNILLVGDSFSEGLMKDVNENLKEDLIYSINRDYYLQEPNGKTISIEGNWDVLDMEKYLDLTDAVVIEMVDPELVYTTYGFIEYLDSFLDSYIPHDKGMYYPSSINELSNDFSNLNGYVGLYKDTDYIYSSSEFKITLNSGQITNNGLEFEFSIPSEIFDDGKEQKIQISVNGKKVYDDEYTNSDIKVIKINKDSFEEKEDNVYVINVTCSQSFSKEMINSESRDISLQINYIGGIR